MRTAPGGSRRRTVDEALGALRCDFYIEGIVELARYGPGLVAQTLVIDSYDLIKLGVLTVAGHRALRLFRHTILLWPRDRHHVYRRLRAAISCPCSEQSLPSRIDMIVALQHEVDSVTLEQGRPMLAQVRIVAVEARREDRVMKDDHGPTVRIVLEKRLQPRCLRRSAAAFQSRRRIEHDEAHALIIERIRRVRQPRRAVAWERELRWPMRCKLIRFAPVNFAIVVFMITRSRHGQQACVQEGTGVAPFTPFRVVLAGATMHQLGCVHRQGGARLAPPRPAYHTRVQALHRILGIAEIQERERARLRRGGTNLKPLAPGASSLNTVRVQRFWFQ